MDRTAFPAEARAKFFEDAIGLNENTPESIRVFRIVSAMLLVAIEWNRIRDFVGQDVDLDGETELIQCDHDCLVKIGHAPRFQFNRAASAIAFQNTKMMIDEIETNLESVGAVRDRRSR